MKSKYIQLADKLRAQIQRGDYIIGEAIPSENLLQEEYQLSRHTVRQAIGVLVNEGLLRKEKGSGTYVSNTIAEVLPKRQKTIVVIMTYLSDYIFPSIIRGIEKELSQQGYALLLGTTNNDHDKERECLQQMLDQQVDGIIIEPTKSNQYNPNLSYYIELREKGIPFLMINAFYEELDVQHLCVDDTESGYLGTKYLIENGHKRLLLVTKIDDLQGKYRMKGFIRAVEEENLAFYPGDIITYTTESKNQVVEQIMVYLEENMGDITGVIAYNDEIASLLAQELQLKGIKIPQDLSIVGNDDSNIRISGDIYLTSLSHPKEQMGELAAKSIIKNINEEKNASYYFTPKLIKGQSVKKII